MRNLSVVRGRETETDCGFGSRWQGDKIGFIEKGISVSSGITCFSTARVAKRRDHRPRVGRSSPKMSGLALLEAAKSDVDEDGKVNRY
eukprot:CCRYP_020407-RA/>CCRYP_020407-RA protein AED:0.14 eAED:0.15 QI:2766/0/0.33/1/1/1/3/0/87